MFISFGYLSKKSLLFLILPVVMIIRYIISDKTKPKIKCIFYPCFIKFLCCSISGILWILDKIINKSKKKVIEDNKDKILLILEQNAPLENNKDVLNENESTEKVNKYSNIYNLYESHYCEKIKKEKINNLKKICFLILIYFLDFISVSYQTIIKKTKYNKNPSGGQITLSSAARLFTIAILSHIIIKNTKMYGHHYLSAIIILMILIIIIIFSCLTEKENNKNYFSKMGLMILQELLFSIMYVCGEKYLSISEGNIYKFLFIDGIVGMILSILLQVISYSFIKCNSIEQFFEGDIKEYCDKNNHLNTMVKNLGYQEFGGFYAIPNIIALFFDIWLLWLVIFNFSANHFGAIYSIPLIYRWSSNKNFQNSVVCIIGNIIIILMTFVYNEIIILRFCGFDKNTAVEINRRSVKDLNCDFGENENGTSEKSDSSSLILQDVNEEISKDSSETL